MNHRRTDDSESRFAGYVEGLASVIGNKDREEPLRQAGSPAQAGALEDVIGARFSTRSRLRIRFWRATSLRCISGLMVPSCSFWSKVSSSSLVSSYSVPQQMPYRRRPPAPHWRGGRRRRRRTSDAWGEVRGAGRGGRSGHQLPCRPSPLVATMHPVGIAGFDLRGAAGAVIGGDGPQGPRPASIACSANSSAAAPDAISSRPRRRRRGRAWPTPPHGWPQSAFSGGRKPA